MGKSYEKGGALEEQPQGRKKQGAAVNEEDGQLTISQLSLNVKNNSDSAFPVKKKKPLETKRKHLKIQTKHLGQTQKAKQVASQRVVKTSRTFKLKRVMMENLSKKIEANVSVMERAKEVQAKLATDLPSFLKMLQPSHCSRGFFVKLPKDFCSLHLPTHDVSVTLVDESERQYVVTFLSERLALSGGWRWFVRKNNLVDGDVLVFQLIEPLFFKVYIVRANTLDEVDVALGLLNLDTNPERCDLTKVMNDSQPSTDKAVNHGQDLGTDAPRHTVSPIVDFKEMKGIENFTIMVNGLTVGSELSDYHMIKYYELCSQQNGYLHDKLLKNINSKLAAEIISETINIADAIGTRKISFSPDEYAQWDRTLKSFEVLGMKVGFLRARLDKLASLACVSDEVRESRFYKEAKMEKICTDEEMKTLKSKLRDLKKKKKRLKAEIASLKPKAKRHELMFQSEANAPWQVEAFCRPVQCGSDQRTQESS